MIFDSPTHKLIDTPEFHMVFDKRTGYMATWGRTKEEDPIFSQVGPLILDLEISEGDCINCPFCYKENGPQAHEHHMTLNEFKVVLDKFPKSLTQIAFGITNLNSNKDFRAMAEHARANGVIPNYTFNGFQMDEDWADWTVKTCGAVACSVYNKEVSYNSIKMLTDRGMKQVNIHFMLSQETLEGAWSLLHDRLNDPRLAGLNAIVFLAYKPKGRNRGQDKFHTITDVQEYQKLIQFCREHNISFGCDSCSAPLVLKAYEEMDPQEYKRVNTMIEPCEASCFSSYVNCHGYYFPCSFTEGEGDWETGLDVLECEDFMDDIWNNPKTMVFRGELVGSRLIKSIKPCGGCLSQTICRVCPTFPGISCGGK